MSFENIPLEMRERIQWVTFELTWNEDKGKYDKMPYTPGTRNKALSNKPTSWRTFDEAVADEKHIGFCFSSQDPYVFIDIDEEQPALFEAFNSYSQRSVSGKGVHIIARGSFEGDGKHPSEPNVGLFATGRFCVMTGEVIDDRTAINEVDPNHLQGLYNWLSTDHAMTNVELVETAPSLEDAEIYEKAKARFDTFESLWNGNHGPDHSESDHALIAMLTDVSESNEQVRRMWFSSPLCRPHRATDKYVDRTIKKSRGKQAALNEIWEASSDEEAEPEVENEEPRSDRTILDSMPDGLLKRVAQWHWDQAYYPLQECSIAMALATASTVTGRNFQTSGKKGLNPWVILVGITASGKSEYQNGMSKLFNAVSKHNKFGKGFRRMLLGKMASGEGLEDAMARNNRVNSYFPEFHETFHNLVDTHMAPHHRSLKDHLLDLHGQCSEGVYLKRRNKARAKDDTEELVPIEAPCFVVSGETTPNEFYGKMGAKDIASGFLQRFIMLNVSRASISRRPNRDNVGKAIPEDLLDELLELFNYCDELEAENRFETVKLSKEARRLLEDYEDKTRDQNLDGNEEKQSSNRAAMKTMQIAAQFAVWRNFREPLVTEYDAEWAISFVEKCEEELSSRFNSGEIGNGQGKQEAEIREVLKKISKLGSHARQKEGIPVKISKRRDVVPYTWLKRRVVSLNSFSTDRNGPVSAFERCLTHMTTAGELMRISAESAAEKYGKGCGPMIGIIQQ